MVFGFANRDSSRFKNIVSIDYRDRYIFLWIPFYPLLLHLLLFIRILFGTLFVFFFQFKGNGINYGILKLYKIYIYLIRINYSIRKRNSCFQKIYVESFISPAFLSCNRYFQRTRGIELQRKRARPLFPLKERKERENRIHFPH